LLTKHDFSALTEKFSCLKEPMTCRLPPLNALKAAARQENFTRAADKSQDALEVSKQHLDAFAHAACRRRGNHCVSAQFN
jgi:hypothetical protein